MEKREAPWGLRPGEERAAAIDAWRGERGMSRNAAVLLMIDMALEQGSMPAKSKPAAAEKPVVKAEAAVRAKGLPIETAADLGRRLDLSAVPLGEGRMVEPRRDTGAGGWFSPKGKK